MSTVNRLQVQVLTRLSCQAVLAGALAAEPEWQAGLPEPQYFQIRPLRQGRFAVVARSAAVLTQDEAGSQFAELRQASSDWPASAPAAEWEALAWLRRLQAQGITIAIGSLPLWTSADGEESERLAALVIARNWPVRSASRAVPAHSLLAVAALNADAQAEGEALTWRLSAMAYGQASESYDAPELMVYAGRHSAFLTDQVAVIEANIDDQNPELYQDAVEALFSAGALDVLLQPIYMKKQRPGILLQVICRPQDAEALSALVLQQTASLGVRQTVASRRMLERQVVTVQVAGGSVRVKLGYHQGQLWNVAPEYEDCRRLAKSCNQPVKLIYQQAITAFWDGNRN